MTSTYLTLIKCSIYLSALLWAPASLTLQAATFQAEDYNAFYDTTPGNSGNAYRFDDVDIEPTTDSGGGYNVGWIDASEWLVFSDLNIPSTGNYEIKARVASPNGGTLSVDLNAGNIVLGQIDVPNTGSWQSWQTVSKTVHIDAGTYNLGLYAVTGGWNINWLEITPVSGGPGSANGTHKRLKIINGCNEPMWVQWITSPGNTFNAPNHHRLPLQGSSIEYDIPDKGLAAMRFWPGFGCDANGHNCRVGASGGPAELGFTCPPRAVHLLSIQNLKRHLPACRV
ncbi:carbohydrate-binding protein [Microbulbifer epialgicus]|uniref:Carbohydrate-binding protein n=1 Tax=Microbulbifer epialgicus TaxID=393907 RepID=A0ABV4P4K3_9GAMM